MSNNSITRLRYFEEQFLRTQDFTDEQAYHLAMRRRHNIAHHTWGIVRGLELVEEERQLFIEPGMAVDGFGRELVLSTRQPLSTKAFVSKKSNVLNVWLMYGRMSGEQAPAGYVRCDDADGWEYRWQEIPWHWLEPPDPGFDPRCPEVVPKGDLDFDGSDTPPDDPGRAWPVFLGQLVHDPGNSDKPYDVDMTGRPYVGVVGETVRAPSGRAWVEIGTEAEDGSRHFAVFVPESEAPDAEPPEARLEIVQDGEVTFRGQTTLDGDLKLVDGGVEFTAGIARKRAQPWRIYHAKENDEHELRIEIAAGSKGSNRVAIGFWSSDDKKFERCLVIDDKCDVTVHGNLIVKGAISYKSMLPGELDPAARQYVASTFQSGLMGANALLGQTYLRETPAVGVAPLERAKKTIMPVQQVRAMVEHLVRDEKSQEDFIDVAKQYPKLLKRLRTLAPEEDEGSDKDEG